MSLWKRPSCVPVGITWRRFQSIGRDGELGQMYQIRDLEYSQKKKALRMLKEYYLTEEPLCEAAGVLQDPDSVMLTVANWDFYISQNVSLACFTEVNGMPRRMVGFNMLFVMTKNDVRYKNEDLETIPEKAFRNMLATVLEVENKVDIFKTYKTDKYMTSLGLVVLPEHREQNIELNMFEASKSLCFILHIKASASIFTAIDSQDLAAKCGYDVLTEFEYNEMMAHGIDLSACTTPKAKLMAIRNKIPNEENESECDETTLL